MGERALFISRTSAHLAAIRHGRKIGLTDEMIASQSRAYPIYRLGEIIGYEAWVPAGTTKGYNIPIMEQ